MEESKQEDINNCFVFEDNYLIENKLAEGSFGHIYVGKCRLTN